MLTLQQLDPIKARSYSPILYEWLRKQCYAERQLDIVWQFYQVREYTGETFIYLPGTFVLGRPDSENAILIGQSLNAISRLGVYAKPIHIHEAEKFLQPLPTFWEEYLANGRCAFDPEHMASVIPLPSNDFTSDKLSVVENFGAERYVKTSEKSCRCMWCGRVLAQTSERISYLSESWLVDNKYRMLHDHYIDKDFKQK